MLLLLYSQSYFFYFLKQESHIKQKAHPPTITLNKPVFAAIIYGEDRLKRQNEIKRRKNFTCKMSVYERIVQYAFLFLEMSEK